MTRQHREVHVGTVGVLLALEVRLREGPRGVVCAGCGCLCLPEEPCPGCRARQGERRRQVALERWRADRAGGG